MVSIPLYRRLSSLFPKPLVQGTTKLLIQGGFRDLEARTFLGFALFFSLGASLMIFFLSPFFTTLTIYHSVFPLVTFVGCLTLFYVWLSSNADSRARKIEQMLPIAMQMISANIRAGMTLESAVWSSARPEFGPFKDEIERMSADSFGGAPINEAFQEMTKRVNSQVVERAIRLINEGIVLGGEMAHLLDQVAFDIRSSQLLQREVAVATTTYAIFIIFSSIIAAPLLFSVSTYYAILNEQIASKQLKTTGGSNSAEMGGQGAGGISNLPGVGSSNTASIKSGDIKTFSIACIAITAFFASMITGLMRDGKATRGLRWVPVFVIVGLGIYLMALYGIQSAFSSIVK
ncbi:TPA: hypothetical protein HA244_02455 [Candidatus Micrarchaeota archaeon]|nr:hypothetical protein [Candidatus Micrarchaeota archaeon]